ncbi:hypothetical protein Pedsa_2669 [Pseudopedobacter saltans DSM 12145]|uniref:Uncharacterized protein n=1 Tax=Pseudopedobacter saltans (strain ATCC 51119 / DSM 12145 / JCM 21818 / CCUG 39354 / LMG 10337 / NBRC 100064 / NCIMB 13643) TaxID=762903 RepID=F0S697_PSESL|nr:hypothetical protein [Pseudopedobacter saltans]ADY53211.1 hypothetical protein Pedsa_2669 [Pseudopedobacter saltans DSM 12145]
MMNGINIVTDEKGNTKAIMLDLVYFKKEQIDAKKVIEGLSDLQKLIDESVVTSKKDNDWESAKSKLEQLKNLK